jgi:hypothetical protein
MRLKAITVSALAIINALLLRRTEAFGVQPAARRSGSISFSASPSSSSSSSRPRGTGANAQPQQGDTDKADEEEQAQLLTEADKRLSDLLPPTVNFAKDSVLFSENPATQRNNPLLKFWRRVKSTVPPIVTGAWPWRDPHLADEDPMSAFYNICFVRLPVIVMGLVYTNNLVSDHPLIMDYGDGPFEVSPLIVYGVLAVVLA